MTGENPFGADTVEELLPTLSMIEDTELYIETADLITDHCPRYFWHAPAASTYNHHNPFCCGKHGLWIHTLMAATVLENKIPSFLKQDLITSTEADYARSAILIHDMRKHGTSYEQGDTADRDHANQAADLIREESDLPEKVAGAVESHMGGWYDPPSPETWLQHLVHLSDLDAATKNGNWGIYRKPDPIREFYPMIPEADL